MRAAKLNSRAIERIAYDDEQSTLSFWFKGSGKYVYFAVPPSVFDALRSADSAGRMFCQQIKGRYPCRFDPARRKFRPD
ncbi:MAG TPA: KTSC domain-containing protein [Allosphingosinicella sp.]|nr:KTSC domain-containing protein [Allosphingosinicella sp.]